MIQELLRLPLATVMAGMFYVALIGMFLHGGFRRYVRRVVEMPEPSTHEHYRALDSIRGLTALLVAASHCWYFCMPLFDSTQQQWLPVLGMGMKSVPIFCVLSGFLIYRSLKKVQTMEDLRGYAWRRFLRVYPAYFATTVALFIMQRIPCNGHRIASEFFMLRAGWFPWFANPPTWSLYVELVFYAVLPVLVCVCRKRPLLWASAALIICAMAETDYYWNFARENWLLKYFAAGIIASEAYDWIIARLGRTTSWWGEALFFVGCSLLWLDFTDVDWAAGLGLTRNPAKYTAGLALAMIPFLVGLMLSVRVKSVLATRPLRFLGIISFSLYLWHPIYLAWLFPSLSLELDAVAKGQMHLFEGQATYPAWFMPIVVLPGQLLLAALSFVLIERPFLALRPRKEAADALTSAPQPEVPAPAPAFEPPAATSAAAPVDGEFIPKVPELAPGHEYYSPVYHYDGLWNDPKIIHNHDFMRDPAFLRAINRGKKAFPFDYKMPWRLHVALYFARRAVALQGDFVECGVWRGYLSSAIMEYLDWNTMPDRRFFLFDTFDGMVESQMTKSELANRDKIDHLNKYFRDNYEHAKNNFADFKNVNLIRGIVPDTLPQADISKVSYLSIDMNCVQPELAAAEYFWDKLSPSAAIILDDYGFVSYEQQKAGFDAFAKSKGVEVLALPTGQGIIMKP